MENRTMEQIKPNTSVISGTHRAQDLIPAFLDVIREYNPAGYAQIILNPSIPAYVQDEGDSSEWWDSSECADYLDSLFYDLGEIAPEDCYFGAHPGNGSDFGFWTIEEAE